MPSSPASSKGGALAGLRVIDLSRVLAGPLCAQMLGDHGADVIKIEPPGGDETRTLGPPFDDKGDAAYFSALNRSKRGISLDLTKPQGRDVLLRLLENADVLIENTLPGTMERWGLGYERDLAERFPRLIYCGISGFGADGPLGGLPGYDAVLQAMGGVMSINGSPESGPLRVGIPLVDITTGYNSVVGILLALAERGRSGRGQRVETTLFDSAIGLLIPHAANWLHSGRTPQLTGSGHPNIAPYDKYKAGGREIFLGVVNQGQYRKFCAAVDRTDLVDDPRFRTNADRLGNRVALRAEIEKTLAPLDAETLCRDLMAVGVPAGPVNKVPDALGQPHTSHRAMRLTREGYEGVAPPVKLGRTPAVPTRNPPRYAEHTDGVLMEAGFTPDEIAALKAAGAVLTKK
jgi:crotonobetainyl-CoA:carnitine CoA-transferase CaiB-like acyl-CoA transferase